MVGVHQLSVAEIKPLAIHDEPHRLVLLARASHPAAETHLEPPGRVHVEQDAQPAVLAGHVVVAVLAAEVFSLLGVASVAADLAH